MLEYDEIVYAEKTVPAVLRVVSVQVLDGYRLGLEFSNGERRVLDMTPLLDKGVFKELRDKNIFAGVNINPDFGCLEWKNGEIDIDTYTAFAASK